MDTRLIQPLKRLFDRPEASNKYDFGHILVVGGAPGMVGAPFLTAMAALRVGAGLVTIASEAAVVDKLERDVKEIMTLRLENGNAAAAVQLRNFADRHKVKVMAVGPGLNPAHSGLVRRLLQTTLPVVLDAGGLGAYDNDLPALRAAGQRNPHIVLTPHPGEFQRLAGAPLPQDKQALATLLHDTAVATQTVIVLKGNHTLVASPNDETYTNLTGNPGLATAGTGDVLSGIIAGLLGQGLRAFEAATCGVYLHGTAGDLAAAARTQPGLIASDVTDSIPAALQHIQTKLG